VSDFATRDPATSAFWDERYRAGFMPWDARGVPAAFGRFVEAAAPGRRVLLPGCGSAYEAGYLDARGFEVTAIDIAPEALARAREVLGADVADRVLAQADFFTFEAAVDWIYERALLCALPYRLWPDYVAAASRLLDAGGLLAGFFFVHQSADEPRRGPPFAAHRAEIDGLFTAGFERLVDEPVPAEQSIPAFAGHERWMVWRRRADGRAPPGGAS
jgi:SAM-dependent methyltransferase